MERLTEKESHYKNLENMSVNELLTNINNEDASVAQAVNLAIPQIEALMPHAVERVKEGGRLFYIGAGTSGRLGVLDAAECPPTFGVSDQCVIGLIAGGEQAIRKAVENAEDSIEAAWDTLLSYDVNAKDVIVGIAASGTTPYVLGGLLKANEMGCVTACIVCNNNSPIAEVSKFPIEVLTGPEFVTGSTRMKAGTATKLILNMISTALMIKLGKVKGNRMVNMKMANSKLRDRGLKMLVSEIGVSNEEAAILLEKYGNVSLAISNFNLQN